MSTFSQKHIDLLRESLEGQPEEGREYVVQIGNYGHRIEAAVSQVFPLPDGGVEQFRKGAAMDMDNVAIRARIQQVGFDRAFDDFCMMAASTLPAIATAALYVARHIEKAELAKGRVLP